MRRWKDGKLENWVDWSFTSFIIAFHLSKRKLAKLKFSIHKLNIQVLGPEMLLFLVCSMYKIIWTHKMKMKWTHQNYLLVLISSYSHNLSPSHTSNAPGWIIDSDTKSHFFFNWNIISKIVPEQYIQWTVPGEMIIYSLCCPSPSLPKLTLKMDRIFIFWILFALNWITMNYLSHDGNDHMIWLFYFTFRSNNEIWIHFVYKILEGNWNTRKRNEIPM